MTKLPLTLAKLSHVMHQKNLKEKILMINFDKILYAHSLEMLSLQAQKTSGEV